MSAGNEAQPADPLRRLRLEIHGAVQGVGFRPFVYRLATETRLAGWVINNSQGVFIEVEGPEARVQRFLDRLPDELPPRAIVYSMDKEWLDPAGYHDFAIRHSDETGPKTALVLPDVATCPDCLAEMLDPTDRRYGYPFTNCTNCGPRFSIIQALPYDRPNTTMRRFVMCPACQAEYDDPRDRRFHAQPNACPVCGPRVRVWGVGRGAWGRRFAGFQRLPGFEDREAEDRRVGAGDWELTTGEADPIREAADALRAGQIVAVKGLGGFHLMVDAGNATAVERLRLHKPRRDKPFALMVRDLAAARALCNVSQEAEALLTSTEAPIVLLPRLAGAPVADVVAPGNPTLGVMLPYTPLHRLLLDEVAGVARSETGHSSGMQTGHSSEVAGVARSETGHSSGMQTGRSEAMQAGRSIGALVATSGNLSDEPICTDEHEAAARLGHIADLFLVHDRPIERHVDDSVAWIVDGEARLLRRARGFAPLPVLLREPAPVILAVGAHLKNTVALSVGRQAFISQHIGDLETPEALAAFERVIADFLRLYEAQPVAIAHDLHPEYLSTKWAQERERMETRERRERGEVREKGEHGAGSSFSFPSFPSFSLLPVQHHHAHLAACLAEHAVDRPALGVIWDGTGYGTDGTIWGGEFLLGDAREFQRVAHLRPFRLPGGDAAVKEPRRVAFAMLWEMFGDEILGWKHLSPVRSLRVDERTVLAQMLQRGLNSPVTTSAGRLFDGVAALIGLQQHVSFEGQAAMELEFAADPGETSAYQIDLAVEPPSLSSPVTGHRSPSILDWQPLVEAILGDLRRGVSSGMMAARFHNALVDAIVATAQQVGEGRVALSGGCFQNRLLTERSAQRLRLAGFEVLLHRQVPPNDGGISLGQIAVAAARISEQ